MRRSLAGNAASPDPLPSPEEEVFQVIHSTHHKTVVWAIILKSFAFSLIKNDFLKKPFINSSIQNAIFNSFLEDDKSFYREEFNNLQLKSDGLALLTSLKMLEKGHDSSSEEIKKALSLLNKANHGNDSKKIAIELLVHSSIKKW